MSAKIRWLSPERFHLDSELAGAELASPRRRALAFALDWALLFLPCLAVSLAAAALFLKVQDPAGYRAMKALWLENPSSEQMAQVRRDLAPLLVRIQAPGLPTEVVLEVERGDLEAAGRALEGRDFLLALSLGEHEEKEYPEGLVAIRVERLIPKWARAAATLGVAALYFVFFTAGRKGATPGKRLLGLRVVSLEGGRLQLLESFERFAGYLEIPATLGLSLVYLWRDPNRRMTHDRVAGTAVVRVRRGELCRVAAEPEPEAPAKTPHPSGPEGESPEERVEGEVAGSAAAEPGSKTRDADEPPAGEA